MVRVPVILKMVYNCQTFTFSLHQTICVTAASLSLFCVSLHMRYSSFDVFKLSFADSCKNRMFYKSSKAAAYRSSRIRILNIKPRVANFHLKTGCFKSSKAADRSWGFVSKHLNIKSRKPGLSPSGISGGPVEHAIWKTQDLLCKLHVMHVLFI